RAAGVCGCRSGRPAASTDAFSGLQSNSQITGMKVFGVSLTPNSDRPYVFVKLETNQGVVGWGEGTLEGKASAVMACMNDFRDFIIGSDPMQVEHHWQSMYVHSFYRAGPVIGSAISGIDQRCGTSVAKCSEYLFTSCWVGRFMGAACAATMTPMPPPRN